MGIYAGFRLCSRITNMHVSSQGGTNECNQNIPENYNGLDVCSFGLFLSHSEILTNVYSLRLELRSRYLAYTSGYKVHH